MIRVNGQEKKIKVEGSMAEVCAECVMVLRAIYKKNLERFSPEVAAGILTNMGVLAIKKGTQDLEEEISIINNWGQDMEVNKAFHAGYEGLDKENMEVRPREL